MKKEIPIKIVTIVWMAALCLILAAAPRAQAAVYKDSYGNQLSGRAKEIYGELVSYYSKSSGTGNHQMTLSTPITYTAAFDSYGNLQETAASKAAAAQIAAALQSAMEAFEYDCPEVFWVGQWSYTYSTAVAGSDASISKVTLRPVEITGGLSSQISQYRANVKNAVASIRAGLKSGSTRYQTVKAIHDYLCRNLSYGTGSDLMRYSSGSTFLGSKIAACEGYSKAFKVLCGEFSIPCALISGTALNRSGGREDHMWNAVQMENGAWYLVDVTWDDQASGIMTTYLLKGTDSEGFLKKISAERTENGDFFGQNVFVFSFPVLSKSAYPVPAGSASTQTGAKVGTTLVSGSGMKYVVSGSGEVTFSGAASGATSCVIPVGVMQGGVLYKVTSIAANAFKNQKKLTSVIIGKHVTTIGKKAFYNCSALKKIVIPKNVKKIGASAFQGCKKLKKITFKTTKLTAKKVGSRTFKGTPAKATVTVPKKVKKAYKKWLVKKGISKKAKIK